MPQGVSQMRIALYAALQGLFPDAANKGTLVTWGEPGNYQPNLIVAMMNTVVPITQPTGSPVRSRDKRTQTHVIVSAYAAGGPEAQPVAEAAAWAAADAIEAYFRVSPNEQLAGACYNAFVEQSDITPSVVWERVDGMPDPVAAGRTADIDVVVTTWIRI
jgi:hypothetical protein